MIGKIFGAFGVPVLLVGLIWLGAVIYFQQSGANIGSAGIVVWFVLVPLAAVGVWFIGKAILARDAQAAAPITASADQTAAPAEQDETLKLQLAVLSAEVNTAAGESAEGLVNEIRKGQLRPAFVETLVDDDGMAIKAACCTDLADEEHLPWVEQWLRNDGHAADADTHDAGAEAARLLALLDGPLQRSLDTLANLPATEDTTAAAEHGRQSAKEPLPRPLVTKVFAPPAWQEMVTAYARAKVTQLGGFAFGVVRADAARPELQSDCIRVADAFCRASATDYAQSIFMVIACDSLVAQAHVDVLAAGGRLFTPTNQSGLIPGEAAAIVIAAPPGLATTEPLPLAGLRRAAFASRQKPVDAGGRAEAGLLQQLGSAALANAEQEAATIAVRSFPTAITAAHGLPKQP